MFLPPGSFRVASTEEDAKRCSSLTTKDGHKNWSFKEEGIQRHYEYFHIQRVSKYAIVIVCCLMMLYLRGLYATFVDFGDIWVMRSILFVRLLICAVFVYIHYKIFHARIQPDKATREEFYHYVNNITTLSNIIIVAWSLVNGFGHVWKTSLGSCFHFDSSGEEIRGISGNMYFYDCNPSHEMGTTPRETMLLLVVGNLLCITTLRSHSYWATLINYVVMVVCISCAAAISPSPLLSFAELCAAISSLLLYNVLENNSMTLFKTLLELESTNRAKTAELKHFIGNVAHDLKTPLHGFTMCMDHLLLASQDHMPSGQEKRDMLDLVQTCQANCSFMRVAINRTVEFAKNASNIALTAKMEPSSIGEAVQWAVTCMKSTQLSDISIEVEPLPPGVCDFVVTDKHWLMENVLCYLSNAVKYSASGMITVSVSLPPRGYDSHLEIPSRGNDNQNSIVIGDQEDEHTVPPAGMTGPTKLMTPPIHPADDSEPQGALLPQPPQLLRIAVADQGIGIEEGKQSMLFRPFQQTMRLAGGTGLGLYSLSKRVEVLEGSFGVENRSDGQQGSVFWFNIPYSPDVAFANEMASMKISENLPQNLSEPRGDTLTVVDVPVYSHLNNNLTALVVEDSVVILKATTRLLVKAGYAVEMAINGAIGLEKMKQNVYSVVIMDLQMPIMDGLEACRRIRKFEEEEGCMMSNEESCSKSTRQRQRQFIIGSSANGADDVLADAMKSGMDLFVPKPFALADLVKCQQQAALARGGGCAV